MRFFVLCFVVAAVSASAAPSKLELTVHTAGEAGFLVTSTLVSGEREAILIDAQFTLAEAHRVVARLLESGKTLKAVYVTHAHPDHYFGLEVFRQAFPSARVLARRETIDAIRRTSAAKLEQWKPLYGNNLTARPIVPEALEGATLSVDGEAVRVSDRVQGDEAANTYVWIPSLKAVVTGDIAYAGVYPWTAETTPAQRRDWARTLDEIAALGPEVVVPGHRAPDGKSDASVLAFTKAYLAAFDVAVGASRNAEELQATVKREYPGLKLDVILKIAADAAFPKPAGKR